MPEAKKPWSVMDPTELWKQWYEASAKAWSDALDGGKEPYVDPYGFYRGWLKAVGNTQEQMKAQSLATMNTKEIWNAWFEATAGAWKRAAEAGGDPLGLTRQWLEMMEELRNRMMTSEILPADPFTFFRKWYDATSETWAKVVDDMLNSEKFIESASPFLEVYSTFVKSLRQANEEFFRNLQIPTRSDLARIAELVVTLEEKVDKIDDMVENLEDGYAAVATKESVGALQSRLSQVESKLDRLAASLEKNQPAETGADESIEQLTRRLDQVESKLDEVLTVLQKSETVKPTSTVRRKKQST